MKKLIYKNKFSKFIVALMIVFSLISMVPTKSEASDDSWGGKLATPVCDLLLALGDGAMNLLHRFIMNQDKTIAKIDLKNRILSIILNVVLVVVVATVAVILVATAAGALTAAVVAALAKLGAGALIVGKIVSVAVAGLAIWGGVCLYSLSSFGDSISLPLFTLTPEEIFKGNIALFNVNFFDPTLETDESTSEDEENVAYTYYYDSEGNKKTKVRNSAEILQPTVASWYQALRTIALVGMLSVLVYIGIRIVISSSAEDKAKYKKMIGDWVVGICLLFVMHYFMAFMNIAVDKVTDVLTTIDLEEIENNETPNSESVLYAEGIELTSELEEAITKSTDDGGLGLKIGTEEDPGDITKFSIEDEDGNSTEYIYWPTNLMGRLRIQAQYARTENEGYWGYTIMYLTMVFLTGTFCWTYLRRVIYMAFLTLIAPFMALTYPIDKIKDGSAQGFNFWFREYLYNLLLQPLHLLLYTILITSALELAATNVVYGIVAIAFMVPAEKLLKQMFGFKGTTPGGVGIAGAAVAMSAMQKLLGRGPKEEDNNVPEKSVSSKTRMKDVDYSKITGQSTSSAPSPSTPTQTSGGGSNAQGATTPSLSIGTSSSMQNGSNDGDQEANNWADWYDSRGDTESAYMMRGISDDGSQTANNWADWYDAMGDTESADMMRGTNNSSNPPTVPTATNNPQNTNPQPPTGNDGSSGQTQANSSTWLNRLGETRGVRTFMRNMHPTQVGKQMGRNATRRIANRVKKIKPTRLFAGVALGAVGAGIGVAAGAATGDFSKVTSYGAAGALAGNKAGRGVASVFGFEESMDAVNQANMTDQELQERERNKVLNDNAYQLQRDTENKKTKNILDTKMSDGRTIREAAIDQGFSYDEQRRIAAYAQAEENQKRFEDLQNKEIAEENRASIAQELFDEVDSVRTVSNNMGVNTIKNLDSATKQAKMEQLAKNTDSEEYARLKDAKNQAQSTYDAAKTAKDKQAARNRINEIEKKMSSLTGATQVANAIDSWGGTDKS